MRLYTETKESKLYYELCKQRTHKTG